jgi:hypothetical protein
LAPGLTDKHSNRLERNASHKHSSISRTLINYGLSGAPLLGRLLALPTNIMIKLERPLRHKHSSLSRTFVNYGRKIFFKTHPAQVEIDFDVGDVLKPFSLKIKSKKVF